VTDPARIAALFAHPAGFRFARWGRPVVPVAFGTDEAGDRIVDEAVRAVAGAAGVSVQGLDPELGANHMTFFCGEWAELPATPGLARLLPGVEAVAERLAAAGANQYRVFGFEPGGAIRSCVTLLRYDADLQRVSAQALATAQAVRSLLLWGEGAFRDAAPVALAEGSGAAEVKPWVSALLRAAYDPVLPDASSDAALAHRLAARMGAVQGF
jgi:hypothetical protein